MAVANIFYPSGPDFDLDYYINKHMPLAARYVYCFDSVFSFFWTSSPYFVVV